MATHSHEDRLGPGSVGALLSQEETPFVARPSLSRRSSPRPRNRSALLPSSAVGDDLAIVGTVRLEILVRPNAPRGGVGGNHDGALVVRVAEPPDRGRATGAALRALAESFGVPSRNVTLVRGTTSRRKVVEIEPTGDAEEPLQSRLRRLLEGED